MVLCAVATSLKNPLATPPLLTLKRFEPARIGLRMTALTDGHKVGWVIYEMRIKPSLLDVMNDQGQFTKAVFAYAISLNQCCQSQVFIHFQMPWSHATKLLNTARKVKR